jgi:hypothetical protein
VGASAKAVAEPEIKELLEQSSVTGKSDSIVLGSRIISVQAVHNMAKQWTLLISWPLADAEKVVQRLLTLVSAWAIFVVISVTGIFVSTSLQLIRGHHASATNSACMAATWRQTDSRARHRRRQHPRQPHQRRFL